MNHGDSDHLFTRVLIDSIEYARRPDHPADQPPKTLTVEVAVHRHDAGRPVTTTLTTNYYMANRSEAQHSFSIRVPEKFLPRIIAALQKAQVLAQEHRRRHTPGGHVPGVPRGRVAP